LSECECRRVEPESCYVGAGGEGCGGGARDVGTTAELGEGVVGQRIEVLWPEDYAWFVGLISSFNRRSGLHLVKYDDGDKQRVDLSQTVFRLVGDEPCVMPLALDNQPDMRCGAARRRVGAKRGGVAKDLAQQLL
jgi:hypothetical protein